MSGPRLPKGPRKELVQFSTRISEEVDELLRKLSFDLKIPRSAIIEAAVRMYANTMKEKSDE